MLLTVEVAHEALLNEWRRLRGWIDDGRDDLRQHGAYSLIVDEWLTAGHDPDYLLAGGRLDVFEQWRATTTMRLTTLEHEFLDEALRQREQVEATQSRALRSRPACVAGGDEGRSRSAPSPPGS